jgi:hypothetical protein
MVGVEAPALRFDLINRCGFAKPPLFAGIIQKLLNEGLPYLSQAISTSYLIHQFHHSGTRQPVMQELPVAVE